MGEASRNRRERHPGPIERELFFGHQPQGAGTAVGRIAGSFGTPIGQTPLGSIFSQASKGLLGWGRLWGDSWQSRGPDALSIRPPLFCSPRSEGTALQIETVKVADLISDPDNVRTHDERNIDAIKSSLDRFGQQKVIVVDADNRVIAGNGTLIAAIELGWDELRAQRTELTGEEAKAFAIADNRTAELAAWDEEALHAQLQELASYDPDLTEALAFDAKEINAIAPATISFEDDDDPVEVPEAEPITQPGELIILGEHRLLCGDATNPNDVHRVLNRREPFLMVTDPPYGVDYDPKWRLEVGLNKEHQTRAEGVVTNDDNASWQAAWDLFPGTVAYVWHGGLHSSVVAADLEASKFEIRSQIIWVKTSLVIGRGAYHWRHEPCWYASRGTADWIGDRKQSTVWEIPNMHRTQGDVDDGKTVHSTQKPIECMARAIKNHSGEVYDPFLGSGTTLIACERLGRRCTGLEISPAYCDVIVDRWERVTGNKAQRQAT